MPLSVKGYTAHICCDGKELEQYDVQQEDERTVTCWIPSEAGKAFSVHWGDPSSTTMQVIVSVDGRVVLRRGQEGKRTGVFSKLTDRPGRIRAVEFSHLVLTDDETVASASSTSLQKLGVIEVEMRKVKSFCEGEDYYSVGEVLEIGPVHEKSKKAGAHAGSLGKPTEAVLERSVKSVGLERDPFAVFKFMYRSIDILRAIGIAPLPPQTKKRLSQTQGNGADDVDSDQSRRKRPRMDEEEEEAEVKPEQTNEEDEDRVTFIEEQITMLQYRLAQEKAKKSKTFVKREVSPIRLPSDWSNEVIDLT